MLTLRSGTVGKVREAARSWFLYQDGLMARNVLFPIKNRHLFILSLTLGFFTCMPGICDDEALFLKFIKKYGRTYTKGSEEYDYRYNVFKVSS